MNDPPTLCKQRDEDACKKRVCCKVTHMRGDGSSRLPCMIYIPYSPILPMHSPCSLQFFGMGNLMSSEGNYDETVAEEVTGFVRADGQRIVDGDGKNLLLRGMGFGGWMVQEPYMMLVSEEGHNNKTEAHQHGMLARVEKLAGTKRMKAYHKAWLDNYCTETDVKALKEAGFNSIRAPLHYNLFTLPIEEEKEKGIDTWIPDGFWRLEHLLAWCKKYEIYLILDLHAAPGGQGRDAKISDYEASKPSLWEEPENMRKAIAFWVKLAKRYRDETWIGGYNLLNEPNWGFESNRKDIGGKEDVLNVPLKEFYEKAIAAIRAVDPNHILFIDGNGWSNNHNGLWPLNDSNIALTFHKYWNDNTVGEIQEFLNMRKKYNVPLWCGEAGENTDEWYADAVKLLEKYNISWAWWSWKKMESTSGAYSIVKPDGYQELVDYWAGVIGTEAPDPDNAYEILMGVALGARLENTVRNPGVFRALVNWTPDPVQLEMTRTVRVRAENYHTKNGFAPEATGDEGCGCDMGWGGDGDWLSFQVLSPIEGKYKITYRVASMEGKGKLELQINETTVDSIDSLPNTEGWQNWKAVTHEVDLPMGELDLRIKSTIAGWNLNWFEVSYVRVSSRVKEEK